MLNKRRLNYTKVDEYLSDISYRIHDKSKDTGDIDLSNICSASRKIMNDDNVGLKMAFAVESFLRKERIWKQ